MSDQISLDAFLEALKPVIEGNASSINEEILQETLRNSHYSIALGDRAVIIGGNANDAVIVTGDKNVVYIFKGLDNNTLATITRLVEEASVLSTLLTPEQFSQRAEKEALVGHGELLVGRELLLEKIREELAGDIQVLVLYGSGGAGKTRLLLSLQDCVQPRTKIWFTRTEAESVEHAIAALDLESHLVIVIDDAHRFTPLRHIREVLVNPDFTGKVTIVLATRPNFKDMVVDSLSPLRGDRVSFVKVGSLTNADIDQLLQQPLFTITNEYVRHALVNIADGNPLLASIAARVFQNGAHISALTRDQVLTYHLDTIIHDLAKVDTDKGRYEDYIHYLDMLAALGSLEIHNQALMELLHQIVGVSQQVGDRILTKLQTAGLVTRHGTVLTIASEVLADHILFRHFFDPQTKHLDYRQAIIEPFFILKPKDMLKRLAEAEIKGNSQEAGSLLGELLDGFSRLIKTKGNAGKLEILTLLKDVAYLRSDDILSIVTNIIDKPALETETVLYPGWGSFEISHEMVLNQVIELLNDTVYGLSLDDTITCLHKLTIYKLEEQAYMAMRDKAKHALTSVAGFTVGKSYVVQKKLLGHISLWIEQDAAKNWSLSVDLVSPMLSMRWEATEDDPTKPSTITIKWGALAKNDMLQEIRQQAISLLFKMYRLATDLTERIQIVKALEGAVPSAGPDVEVPLEIKTWLRSDCIEAARFLTEIMITSEELPVLDVVANWLKCAISSGKYEGEELLQIQQLLNNHPQYQLYRLLVGRFRHEKQDEQLDWRASEQKRAQQIEAYLAEISEATITQVLNDLSLIAEQAHEARLDNDMYWFSILLEKLGEYYADFVEKLIEKALSDGLALKIHLEYLLVGLRRSYPEKARMYIRLWITSNDELLSSIAVRSHRFIEWDKLQESEWDALYNFITKSSLQLDWNILLLIPEFSSHKPKLAIDLLKAIAKRGDKGVLHRVADVLIEPDIKSESGWKVQITDRQDFVDIIQNFEQLPNFDYAIEQLLDRLGLLDPMLVVDFFERRIRYAADKHKRQAIGLGDTHYHAIPFSFTIPMKNIRLSSVYREVLQRIRDWALNETSALQGNTSQMLKIVAGHLDETLYSVLIEWVQSDVLQKQEAVAQILYTFNDGQVFYNLIQEIIIRTDDESVLNTIKNVIASTSLSNPHMGPQSSFYRKRIGDLSSWLQNSSLRVRLFAKRETLYFRQLLEADEGED